ncbi:hypothetical protein TNCV_2466221 [Trichonephila clavipes]|nr:hypothetical protein TNCV_2466221 [Trichonephila clavipes]
MAGNRTNNPADVCYLSGNRTAEVSEPVSKCRPLINPVVSKSVENATSCDFENVNCDPQLREGKKSMCIEVVIVKARVFEGSVRAVAMCTQQVINQDYIGDGSLELIGDKGVANPEGFIWDSNCEEKDTIVMLTGGEKQLR